MRAGKQLFRRGDAVLIVDDDPLFLELLEVELRRAGCTVAVAGSVAEAIAELEQRPVDAIVSDYSIPGRNGLHLLAYVRCRRLGARFVLASAALPEDAAAAASADGAATVTKDELVATLAA